MKKFFAVSSVVVLALAAMVLACTASGDDASNRTDQRQNASVQSGQMSGRQRGLAGLEGMRGERRGPPPAALEACKELKESDACEFTGRKGEQVEGTCLSRGDTLACAPQDRPRRDNQDRRMGPPPEALEACQGKAADQACEFIGRRGDKVEGTCLSRGDEVSCAPKDRPRRDGQGRDGAMGPGPGRRGGQGMDGQGKDRGRGMDRQGMNRGQDRRMGPPPEALEACQGKVAGDACNFESRRGDAIDGTCREIQEDVVCAPKDFPRRGGPGNGMQPGGMPPQDEAPPGAPN